MNLKTRSRIRGEKEGMIERRWEKGEWAKGEGRRARGEGRRANGRKESGRVGDWESENGRDWTCNMLVDPEKESPCGPPFDGKGGQQTRWKVRLESEG